MRRHHNIYGGGKNTNKYGLKFEKETDLAYRVNRDLTDKYTLKPHMWHMITIQLPKPTSHDPVYDVYSNKTHQLVGVITKQNQFYNVLYEHYHLLNYNAKFWKPDEVFFNYLNNTVYIVEKKEQHEPGSVDEKTFSFINKRWLYQRDFKQLAKKSVPKSKIPKVQFCALFNSDWWLHGIGFKHSHGKKITVHCNVSAYQDNFACLKKDHIKMFFDDYKYSWFGLD